MKRTMSLCLAFLVLILLLSVSVYADYSEGNFYFTAENEAITITGCFGDQQELTIPSMIGGFPVSRIASGAFVGNASLKVVNVPETVTQIDEGAFGSSVAVNFSGSDQQQTDPETPEEVIDVPETTPAPTPAVTPVPDSKKTIITDVPYEDSFMTGGEGPDVLDEDILEQPEPTPSPSPTPSPTPSPSPSPTAEPTPEVIEEAPVEESSSATLIIVIAAVVVVAAAAVILAKKKKK